VSFGGNTTAFEALNEVANVSYKQYDYGKMIIGINGLDQDDTHYWMFFVNGELPVLPSDAYTVDDGDIVAFRYLDSETALGYFS